MPVFNRENTVNVCNLLYNFSLMIIEIANKVWTDVISYIKYIAT